VHTSAKARLTSVAVSVPLSVVGRGDVKTSWLLWRCLLEHALQCSVAQRSRLIPLSVSPNSDEFGKQSLYPDGDPDRHQNLIICSLAHCQLSLKVSCKFVWKFLRKVANKQTDGQTDNDENITSLAAVIKIVTNASAGLQDANPTVRLYATPPPPIPTSDCPTAISI